MKTIFKPTIMKLIIQRIIREWFWFRSPKR